MVRHLEVKQTSSILVADKEFSPSDFTMAHLMSMSTLVGQWQNERPPIQALDFDIRIVMWHFIEEVFEALAEHNRLGIETEGPEKLQIEIEDAIFFLLSLANNLKVDLDYYDVRRNVNGQFSSVIYEKLVEDASLVSREPQLEKEVEHLLTTALSLLFNVANSNPLELMRQLIVKNTHNYPARFLSGKDPETQQPLKTAEMLAQHKHAYRCLRLLRDFEEWRAQVTGQDYKYLLRDHWLKYEKQILDFRNAEENYQHIESILNAQVPFIMAGIPVIGVLAEEEGLVTKQELAYGMEVFPRSLDSQIIELNTVIEAQNQARNYWAENNDEVNLTAYLAQESEELVEAMQEIFECSMDSGQNQPSLLAERANFFYKIGGELADIIYYLIKYCRRVGYKFNEADLTERYLAIDSPVEAINMVASLADELFNLPEAEKQGWTVASRQIVLHLFGVLFRCCDLLDLDPKEIVLYKIIRNECKYPHELVALFEGNQEVSDIVDLEGEGYEDYKGSCRMAWELIGGDEWFADLFERKMQHLAKAPANYGHMLAVAKAIWAQEIDKHSGLQFLYRRPLEFLAAQRS